MRFPLYIAKRYLFTKSSNNAINIITIIAAIGVFAGAFSLFIVLSGFAGLRDFSLSFSNEFDPDLKLFPASGKVIQIDSSEAKKISEIQGISSFSKVIEERVFLDYRSKNHSAFIKGVDENYQRVNAIDSSIIQGTWLTSSEPQVVIGSGISQLLNIGVFNFNSLMKVLVPRPGKGQILNPADAFNSRQVIVAGIYSINEELDDKYVFSNISFARKLLELGPNEYSAIEFRLTPGADPDAVSKQLKDLFNGQVNIKTRAQLNDVLYKMLNTENLAVYLIFTLVLIIALFNVIGSIIMVILDKRDNIRTLFSLGANPRQIKNIFFLQGMLMCIIGGLIGLASAILLIYLQMKYEMVMITPSLPYPVAMKWENILIVILTIGILGLLSSYIAAGRSKKALEA